MLTFSGHYTCIYFQLDVIIWFFKEIFVYAWRHKMSQKSYMDEQVFCLVTFDQLVLSNFAGSF